jgi:quinol monooxygenase YgiN
MIGVVATLRVQDGKASEFEAVMKDLAAKVKANEPGCLFYELAKSRKEPNAYKVLEAYRDQAALDHHASTEYFLAARGAMGACLAGKPELELLDGLA